MKNSGKISIGQKKSARTVGNPFPSGKVVSKETSPKKTFNVPKPEVALSKARPNLCQRIRRPVKKAAGKKKKSKLA